MVSHALSHQKITTGIDNNYNSRSTLSFDIISSRIPSDIFFLVQVFHHVSLGTCTQCVPVVLLANRDQFLDRSDRASNTSFVCWQSIVRFYLCKIRICFLQFQNLPPLCAYQEAPFIVLSPQGISRQLQFVGSKGFVPSHYSALLKNKSVLNVRGW